MRKSKLLISAFAILLIILSVVTGQAQNANKVRFNEILIKKDSIPNKFGEQSSWIELYNSSYNYVNLRGCYLTDDLSNPTKFWISNNDPNTQITGRGYIVFYADNNPQLGVYHLNFDLKNAKVIALFDGNGETLIDKIELPSEVNPDATFGYKKQESTQMEFLSTYTPGAANDYTKVKTAGEEFVEFDPFGIGMTMIAMLVVFLSLAILYIIYKNMGRFFIRKSVKDAQGNTVIVAPEKEEMSAEVNAAIAMALYLYQNELHDYENTVLTINKVSRNYSPWSSKIYTLRKIPNNR